MERNPRRWWILSVLIICTLVLVIDNNVLLVAIPSLTQELGASAQDVQWIIDAYILVSAGMLLTSGSLSDRYGRRRMMIIGLAVFGLASLAAAFAASPGQLIAGRAVMGLGSSLMLPSTLSIIITVFDDTERRKATAIWSSSATIGLVGGPILGGVMTTWFGWGSVFLINVPIAAIAIAAAVALMPESTGPWRKPDPLGGVLSMIGITILVWAIIELPVTGLGHVATLAKFAIAIAALAAFGIWETRTTYPMVPLSLYRDRNFSGGSFALVLTQIGMGGLVLVITQYLQFVLGYPPALAGAAMVPVALAVVVTNALGATLGRRIGNRAMAATGLTVVAASFGLMTTLSPDSGLVTVAAILLVFGTGAGLAQPAAVAALMGAVPEEHAGVGSALNSTMTQTGSALGVAILGSLLTSAYAAAMPAGTPGQATRSIADALALGDAGIAATARDAFAAGMTLTNIVSGAVVLAAAALALSIMRARTATPTSAPRTRVEAESDR